MLLRYSCPCDVKGAASLVTHDRCVCLMGSKPSADDALAASHVELPFKPNAPNVVHANNFHLREVEALQCIPLTGRFLRPSQIQATVLMLTSQTREMDRIDDPLQSMARIWMRLERGSLFMPILY